MRDRVDWTCCSGSCASVNSALRVDARVEDVKHRILPIHPLYNLNLTQTNATNTINATIVISVIIKISLQLVFLGKFLLKSYDLSTE